MSHTVTVTKLPDETSDDIEYDFGGTHDGRCETYTVCTKTWHRHPGEMYDESVDEWHTKRAGWHQKIEGEWMVPDTNKCALKYVFHQETVEEALEGIAVGETRSVTTEWDGGDWRLVVHPAANSLGGDTNE